MRFKKLEFKELGKYTQINGVAVLRTLNGDKEEDWKLSIPKAIVTTNCDRKDGKLNLSINIEGYEGGSGDLTILNVVEEDKYYTSKFANLLFQLYKDVQKLKENDFKPIDGIYIDPGVESAKVYLNNELHIIKGTTYDEIWYSMIQLMDVAMYNIYVNCSEYGKELFDFIEGKGYKVYKLEVNY